MSGHFTKLRSKGLNKIGHKFISAGTEFIDVLNFNISDNVQITGLRHHVILLVYIIHSGGSTW